MLGRKRGRLTVRPLQPHQMASTIRTSTNPKGYQTRTSTLENFSDLLCGFHPDTTQLISSAIIKATPGRPSYMPGKVHMYGTNSIIKPIGDQPPLTHVSNSWCYWPGYRRRHGAAEPPRRMHPTRTDDKTKLESLIEKEMGIGEKDGGVGTDGIKI